MSEILGYDIIKFYKFKGEQTSTDRELKARYKLPIIENVRDLAHKYGMSFYCADNAFRDLGDGPICCGISTNRKGFENFFSTQTSYGAFIALSKGEVHFKDVFGSEKEHEKAFLDSGIDGWLNLGSMDSRIKYKDKTFREKMTFIWDNPNHPNNPSKFFENLEVGGIDEDGHLWFKHNKPNCSSCAGCTGCKQTICR